MKTKLALFFAFILFLSVGKTIGYEYVPNRKEVKTINPISSDCSYKGFKLYGKIKFVNSFPDIKVKVVSSFPDLKVKMVSSFPDDCGEWQTTNSFPDLKVQIVNSFPDIKIKFVDSFPGID